MKKIKNHSAQLFSVALAIAIFSMGPRVEANDNPAIGVPLSIEFDAATLVSELLILVKKSWLNSGKYYLGIEITGVNGGFVHHGTQVVPLENAIVFDSDHNEADVIVDYTADTTPRHVNEVYTVCVQVLKWIKKGKEFNLIPIDVEKCPQFGPF